MNLEVPSPVRRGPRALGPRAPGRVGATPGERAALSAAPEPGRSALPFPPATAAGSSPESRPALTHAPADAPSAQPGWLQRWCSDTSFEARLAGINELSRKRLPSPLAAEVWLHLISKVTDLATSAQMDSLVRQFIQLAPEHAKASVLFHMLMNRQAAAAAAPELVFMITSCERYLGQAERVLADLQARGARACIVTGDPTLAAAAADDATHIRLPVADTYEALCAKVLEGLSFLRQRHGPLSVVKVDDDMRFRRELDLARLVDTARLLQYAGHPIGYHAPDRCWHFGKTSEPKPIFGRRHHGPFAYGPMYLLGPRAVEHLVTEWVFYPGEFSGHLYEDRAVGDTLRKAGIELKPISFAEMGGIVDESERYAVPPA